MLRPYSCLSAAGRPVPCTRSLSLELDWIISPSLRIPMTATFHYTEADPLVVRLELPAPQDPTGPAVTWMISRDLMFDGTEEPSGIGDVRLWPSAAGTGRVLHMRLEVSTLSCLLQMDLARIQDWLLDTFELVHPGTELDSADWDSLATLADGTEDPPRR
ncbi:SsgA family sporulation/cell division regulator [Streptomyces sp. NPDC002265]|uniref:SsgA family sporulation/cell division regulator n=1 Tax=Streptomyces sp. NPDC002265 TaxID=3154415 RepID=UPI003327E16C